MGTPEGVSLSAADAAALKLDAMDRVETDTFLRRLKGQETAAVNALKAEPNWQVALIKLIKRSSEVPKPTMGEVPSEDLVDFAKGTDRISIARAVRIALYIAQDESRIAAFQFIQDKQKGEDIQQVNTHVATAATQAAQPDIAEE